ncbi:ATP-binding protein [Amycolatopsis nigrescens]|uniref:ATP-binding protein n=1 Tax=Amycolatopsis nigrescens TaxID=381445 RepID=UPI000361D798|nr:ATP-binding protein [Amycolatopsis nigrescens]
MSPQGLRAADAGQTGLTVPLDTHPSAAATARRAVGDALRVFGMSDELVDDLLLVTSELVTNAVEHSAGVDHLELAIDRDALLVRVYDRGPGLPAIRLSAPGSARSRGLRLVDALATGWGYAEYEGGKYVWAEFTRKAHD